MPPDPAALREALQAGLRRQQAGEALPRRPRHAWQAGPEGWRLRVELPGVPASAVQLACAGRRLVLLTSGPCPFAAEIPLPPAAAAHSLRWHCAHGLLEAQLAHAGMAEDAP
ncbi:hypothetical protein [Pseudoroseomonas cervicalis]|uniref:hypothetical protein n=1 Tax=Teichococcus cervicalis TaxID=204525 RepID=UPI0022F17EDC|nr:hypothetical protein [Pseudoroseomonas cervicalis]WBV45447.1 hypothetical protein PFY06_21450 [Pseudoroseomonas cervicalis]